MPAMPLTAWATSDRVGVRRTGTVGNPGWAARATSTACATSSVGTGPTEVARPNGSSDAAIDPWLSALATTTQICTATVAWDSLWEWPPLP